jgi:2-(1,2-epoxy-1,2-dihydrophenyl)acetyl-CoA isomerase
MSVELIIEGAVAKVVLNRPEKLNALTREMRVQLREHFERLRFDDAIRAIVVTGEGRAFCTGADVGGMQRNGLRAERERLQGNSHAFLRVMHAIEKPIVAAVRGPTVGIGWSIALACDLIVASETARFSQIFRRIGLAPDGGAIWFLTRRIGMAKAKELVFTARFVEAPEALSLGLVNEVVPDDQLMARADALAADLASGPTFAFGLAKKLFHMASSPSYEDFLRSRKNGSRVSWDGRRASDVLPLPLREGVGGGVHAARRCGATLAPTLPPNPLAQGKAATLTPGSRLRSDPNYTRPACAPAG